MKRVSLLTGIACLLVLATMVLAGCGGDSDSDDDYDFDYDFDLDDDDLYDTPADDSDEYPDPFSDDGGTGGSQDEGGGSATWNTWVLCEWSDPGSFRPIKYQCLELDRFEEDSGYLVNGTDYCQEVLGADRHVAGFSENSLYSSGSSHDPRYFGHGEPLCAAGCLDTAARRNVTCVQP